MKKRILLSAAGVVCAAAVFAGCGGSSEQPAEETTSTKDLASIDFEYDKLQDIFQQVSFDTSEKELIGIIEESKLPYTEQDYNGSPKYKNYKIAFSEDVAVQKYAADGDDVEVCFNKDDGSFMYSTYSNHSTFRTALNYNYGTFFDLREDAPHNEYSGCYFYTPGDNSGGIVIEYSNGNKKETGYHQCETIREAIISTVL